jgi:hypothetical protein
LDAVDAPQTQQFAFSGASHRELAMNYLTLEAACWYFELTAEAFNRGLVSLTPSLERLRALQLMCSHDDHLRIDVTHIIEAYEFAGDDEWHGHHENSGDQAAGVSVENRESVVKFERDQFGNESCQLYPDASTGLSQWEFHQTDRDFFPSVPHGHHKSKPLKLDAYLGWYYQQSKQIGREARWKIIALWNDTKFRSFALASIEFYRREYPLHRWRVPNPWRLPRRHR